MSCATASNVTIYGGEYSSREKTHIGMSVYMDAIAATGGMVGIRKGIRNWAKMKKEKKMRYERKKNYMRVKTEREREEIAEQDVKSERVHETETYQQLRITTNKERNIEE